MFQIKGGKERRREKVSHWKRRETPKLYLERGLWSQLEFTKKKAI